MNINVLLHTTNCRRRLHYNHLATARLRCLDTLCDNTKNNKKYGCKSVGSFQTSRDESFFLIFLFCAHELKWEFFRNYYSHMQWTRCDPQTKIHFVHFAFFLLSLWDSLAMTHKAKRLSVLVAFSPHFSPFDCHSQRGKYSLFRCQWRRAQSVTKQPQKKQLVRDNRVDVS